uniref:Uncharacterized protein n=1 Tax=Hyaloperonospora arabidopsidis (strain Emoy2) TaxID=559515 RepID=M4BYG6_HYAAE
MITWDSTRQLTGGTVWAAQLWHRIKLRAYSTWDTHRQIPGCPLPECQAVYVAYSHQWWECAAAQALWDVFLSMATAWPPYTGRDTSRRLRLTPTIRTYDHADQCCYFIWPSNA